MKLIYSVLLLCCIYSATVFSKEYASMQDYLQQQQTRTQNKLKKLEQTLIKNMEFIANSGAFSFLPPTITLAFAQSIALKCMDKEIKRVKTNEKLLAMLNDCMDTSLDKLAHNETFVHDCFDKVHNSIEKERSEENSKVINYGQKKLKLLKKRTLKHAKPSVEESNSKI